MSDWIPSSNKSASKSDETVQIAKWGNSLAVRIPANVAKTLKLKAGDEVDIVTRFQGYVPKNFTFDRDELNTRVTSLN